MENEKRAHTLLRFEGGVPSWRTVAVLSLIGCIACEVLFNLLPIDHNTLLLYWFYPAALLFVSQLFFREGFIKHLEVKLVFAIVIWSMMTVVLNFRRAQIVDSYQWFASVCATYFLCFALPYAFEKKELSRLLQVVMVAMLVAVTLLSLVGLIAVFAQEVTKTLPSVFEGVGISQGRLGLDTHPNRSSPAPALGVILALMLLWEKRSWWKRTLLAICAAICFVTLALTVSRTAIIAAGIAIGFIVFLWLRDVLRPRMGKILRWGICAFAAVVVLLAFYKGSTLTAQLTNAELARRAVASAQMQTQTQESGGETVAERDLSDADSFNGRTDIWLGALNGMRENPEMILFGGGPVKAAEVIAPYFPEGSPVGIFHNSLIGAFAAFGAPGLLLICAFLVLVAWAALRLSFGKQDEQPLFLRFLPAILIFTFAESMMEDFMFENLSLNVVCVWFMIAAGFVLRLTQKPHSLSAKKTVD